MQRFLVDYTMAMLRAVAQARGIALSGGRQVEATGELAAALLDPFSVRVAQAQLSEGGRQALDALIAAGGKMRSPRFSRRFGQVRPAGPGRLERESLWQEPANPAEELLYLGLAFRAFDRDEAGPGEFFLIPDDLLPLLPAPAGEPPRFSADVVPAPAQPRDAGRALELDLFPILFTLVSMMFAPTPTADWDAVTSPGCASAWPTRASAAWPSCATWRCGSALSSARVTCCASTQRR